MSSYLTTAGSLEFALRASVEPFGPHQVAGFKECVGTLRLSGAAGGCRWLGHARCAGRSSCGRGERFSPLVEHALRTTGLPLDPGGGMPRVLLERDEPSAWTWLAWRLLDPEERWQRPVAQKHPVGAVRPQVERLPWGDAANLQANAFRERLSRTHRGVVDANRVGRRARVGPAYQGA